MATETNETGKWGPPPSVIGPRTHVGPIKPFGNIVFVATTVEFVLLLCDTRDQARAVFDRTMVAMRTMAKDPIVDTVAKGVDEVLREDHSDWKGGVTATMKDKFAWIGDDAQFHRIHAYTIPSWYLFMRYFVPAVMTEVRLKTSQWERANQAAIEFLVDIVPFNPLHEKVVNAYATTVKGTRPGDWLDKNIRTFRSLCLDL